MLFPVLTFSEIKEMLPEETYMTYEIVLSQISVSQLFYCFLYFFFYFFFILFIYLFILIIYIHISQLIKYLILSTFSTSALPTLLEISTVFCA